MPGAGLAHGPPAKKNAGGRYHRFGRKPGIPRAMVLRLYVISSVHRAFWPPSLRDALASSQVSISVGMPGPHDFTSAGPHSSAASQTSTASPPHVS
jgi:hypothetical protein